MKILSKTKDKLEIVILQPQTADFLYAGAAFLAGSLVSWNVIPDTLFFVFSLVFCLAGSYTLIDDTYVLRMDKQQVQIEKTKFGMIQYQRVAHIDELVQVHVKNLHEKRQQWQLQLEFMSDFGYYQMPCHETLFIDPKPLQEIKKIINKWADLKEMPEWMKEEHLKKTFPHPPNI
ncbi:hypothetical protein EDD86DRAFT_210150 [Gorgonomyces haynaldii]|nr:hypothetical protein EDD86DRAFT_210150 [Gorgonomyces haynaldii]